MFWYEVCACYFKSITYFNSDSQQVFYTKLHRKFIFDYTHQLLHLIFFYLSTYVSISVVKERDRFMKLTPPPLFCPVKYLTESLNYTRLFKICFTKIGTSVCMFIWIWHFAYSFKYKNMTERTNKLYFWHNVTLVSFTFLIARFAWNFFFLLNYRNSA